jgi:pimeloyl-ACP methyl ester carboxylesterase
LSDREWENPSRGRESCSRRTGIDSGVSPPLPRTPGVRHDHHALPTGVRLHVAEAGDPAAPAILAVHGWPQHWWAWRGVIPGLAETHRVICPDLRGLGWSGQPDDGDFAKERLADDMLALLDALGIERAGYLGHDWGGWTGWLLGIRAPERFARMMVVSIVHPWSSRAATLLNFWRALYQYPLATPLLGPALVRDGRAVRMMLGAAMDDATAGVFAEVLREPARARASSLLYRHFQLRELPALAAGRYAGARIDLPVKVLFPRGDGLLHPAQLAGLERHAPLAEVELVDGGHLLLDERPELVSDRARAWFG